MRKKNERETREMKEGKVYDPTITVNKLCLCVPGIHLKSKKEIDTKNKAKEVKKELSCS